MDRGEVSELRRRSAAGSMPRRPAPWQAIDLLLIVAFYIAAHGVVIAFGSEVLGLGPPRAPAVNGARPPSADHIVMQLLAAGDSWILMLCIASAVVVTPIVEELFFRVLLQGWLESVQRRLRRKVPALRRLVPRPIGPIVLSSLLFAVIHFRGQTPQWDMESLVLMFWANATANVLTLVFVVELLRWRVGATAADLGWVPRKLPGDIGLGLATFAVIAVPIYAVQYLLKTTLPEHLTPDPVPLFFLALVLGFLYFRTRRLAPIVVVHAALNATSLALATLGWLSR